MEGVGSEVSLKIRSAIKAKLVELGTYVDEELPDYIMVLVANKKTKDQMDDDLSLFLGHNTERFTSWLHHVLQKLNAAALLQVTTPQPEDPKKNTEEEKRKEREEEKKREREEEKKREKVEEGKRAKEEEKRKLKEKEKGERKRKSSEKKEDKKDKKLKKSESPESPDKFNKEKKQVVELVKPSRSKDLVKEKENKERLKITAPQDEPVTHKVTTPTVTSTMGSKALKKIKPQIRGKISSADIFRAEAAGGGEPMKDEEEDEIEEDMLVLRADIDELGLELEEEPAPKKARADQKLKGIATKQESKTEPKIESKVEMKQKTKSRVETVTPVARLSAKERLGTTVPTRTEQVKEKISVLDRLGSSTTGGRRVINLREESSFPPRTEASTTANSGMARAVSSAINSAQRSVCVLPSTTSSSGKKLEARVRPLMSKHIEPKSESSSRDREGQSREASTRSASREVQSRPASTRVVSAVGAVLKRPHSQVDSDDEGYDPKKPQLSGMASKVEVTPRPRRPGAIQANTALILRAMADAHKSVNRPSRNLPTKVEPATKKQKGELFTRGYREREQTRQKDLLSEGELRVRKIAITVPNATRKESEEQQRDEEDKEEMMPGITSSTDELEKEEAMEEIVPQEEVCEEMGPAVPFGLEEVEEVEVEEEVVDEGIEEDQPLSNTEVPEPVVPHVPRRENTKFIVTLEGVDSDVFEMRDDPPDIRSRLGARPIRTDSLEEVEEYIEEVEEWEEEDAGGDLTRGGALSAVGLIAGVKPRLKSAISTSAGQDGGAGNKFEERCRYWPACKAGDSCQYHHPTLPCKAFPSCKFGDKCLYIHPNCIYDAACTRRGCPYTHASSRSLALSAAPVKHKVVPSRTSKIKCKYFPKCTNMTCPFLHPKACFYGMACTQASCPFTHPDVTTGAKLKWIAPKSSQVSTTDIIKIQSKEKIVKE